MKGTRYSPEQVLSVLRQAEEGPRCPRPAARLASEGNRPSSSVAGGLYRYGATPGGRVWCQRSRTWAMQQVSAAPNPRASQIREPHMGDLDKGQIPGSDVLFAE